MDRVKKKVLLDIFASPWTLVPVAAGLSAFIVSWGFDGVTWLNMAGLSGLLAGAGGLATRLIFGVEKLTQDAYRYLNEQQKREREAALDQLDRQLSSEPDPRTEDCLRQLRRLYAGFQDDVAAGRITGQTHLIMGQVEQVFRATVSQLELSYELWTKAQTLRGKARDALLDQREQVIQEVMKTINHLVRTIEQFHTFQVKRNTSELERLRAELDETLLVARRTEQRLADIDQPKTYEPSDFESQE